mmetsp:Transcript_28052/g.82446  ORF Transcript_28052/g.82446 Transcript_28052/m.82446 type:complete len:207 (+) Transcript_28052:715-1335(+)
MDLIAPRLVPLLDVREHVCRRHEALGQGHKGVPLHLAAADVGDDEVLLWADVHFVARVLAVGGVAVALAGEDRVPRVLGSRAGSAHEGLVVHLGAHRGPDAVRADEDVAPHPRAVLHDGVHALHGVALIALHALPRLHNVAEVLEEDLLEVGAGDDARGRHPPRLSGSEQVEFCIPLRTDAILDAALAVAREGGLSLDFAVHLRVH